MNVTFIFRITVLLFNYLNSGAATIVNQMLVKPIIQNHKVAVRTKRIIFCRVEKRLHLVLTFCNFITQLYNPYKMDNCTLIIVKIIIIMMIMIIIIN